jgi:hypothetical protein
MDRFLELLRTEFELELRTGGNYTNKDRMMQAFDKASIKALAKYAKEKNISLD